MANTIVITVQAPTTSAADIQAAREKLSAALIRLVSRYPYTAGAALPWRMVPAPGIGTVGVDAQWRLFFDPAAILAWATAPEADASAGPIQPTGGVAGLTGALFHEVSHVILQHAHTDGDDRDPDVLNIAQDIAVNQIVQGAGLRLPVDGMWPERFKFQRGLTAAQYYDLLMAGPKRPPPQGKSGQGAPQPGQAQQAGQGSPKTRPTSQNSQPTQGKPSKPSGSGQTGKGGGQDAGQKPPQHGPGDGQSCGGVSAKAHPEWEQAARDAGYEVPVAVPPAEQASARRKVAYEVREAAAKRRGDVPAEWVAWAEQELAPAKVRWQDVLARKVRGSVAYASGMTDYSMSRPSRSTMAYRAVMGTRAPYLPGLRRPVPDVGVVLDVSGSMGGGPVDACRSEVLGIVRAIGCPVDSWAVDARVQAKAKVGGKDGIGKLGFAGGGTDMRAGITAAIKAGKKVIVVLTDGYTPWPERHEVPQRVHVIAAIVGRCDVPDWIEHVTIEM